MTQWFLKIYDVLSRRRPWVAGVVCALALLCGVLALRMDYDEDIAAFMPLDEDARKYSEVFSSLGGQNRIAVVFRGRADDRIGVENAMDCFGQAVQRRDTARWVRRLQVRVDESALMDAMRCGGCVRTVLRSRRYLHFMKPRLSGVSRGLPRFIMPWCAADGAGRRRLC